MDSRRATAAPLDVERLGLTLELAGLALAEVDLRTRMVSFTGHATDVLGWQPDGPVPIEDALGRTRVEDAAAAAERLRQTIETGVPFDHEIHVRFPDGSLHWVTWQARRELDRQRKPVRLVAVGRNVTLRHSRIERLAESQALLRTVIDNLPVSIYTKDRDGRYLLNNTTNLRLLGAASEDEVRGKSVFDFFPAAIAARFADDDRRVIESGQPLYNQEEPYVDPATGRHRWFLTTKVPLRDPAGTITGVVGISRDITEIKLREQHLLQSQRVEALGRLAGGVAHDFNNLLTVIFGSLDLLRADPGSTEPLEDISLAASHAAHLTRQLLTFTRQQAIAPRVLDVNVVLAEAQQMLRRLIATDIDVDTRPAPDLWPVCIDRGQLMQVLVNLAINARDAMPNGGRLTVSTANVVLSEHDMPIAEAAPGDYVCLSVIDTGIGLTDEVKAHLFEAFFTTKERGRGTGLGLATAFGIARQSRGFISAEGSPGSGATFRVFLPRHREAGPERRRRSGGRAGR